MKKEWKKYIGILLVAVLITGCAGNGSTQTDAGTVTTAESSASAVTSDSSEQSIVNTLSTTSEIVLDTEFTANDLEVGYEDTTATHITMNGTTTKVSGEGASAKENVLTISEEGVYVISGSLTDGQIKVEAEDTAKIQLVLNGVDITCSDHAPIYIKSADKVFITLKEGSENYLTDGSEYAQTDDNTVDGVIFSKADLTLNGSGVLTVNGNYQHGIVSKDDLVITGGTYQITAVKDALNGKDCVKIKDGIFTLNVTEGNGIQSKNSDDSTKGYVYIIGGEITIQSCVEGIEGTAIVIEGGIIKITAKDDGLNAASGDSDSTTSEITNIEDTTEATTMSMSESSVTDEAMMAPKRGGFGNGEGGPGGESGNNANCYLSISGGTITVDASGDGIDSNGSIYISGGTIYVSGPTNAGNGGLDYNGSAQITGGIVIVASSVGMVQGFSDTSTQYSLTYNFDNVSEADTEVKLTDTDGNVLLSYTPNKEYQSVVISTPDLKEDATYTVSSGTQSSEITISGIVTSSGTQGMNGMGGQRKMER